MPKIVFIHVPKTAGSSITMFLQSHGLGEWVPSAAALHAIPGDRAQQFDYIAGHFTMREFIRYATQEKINLGPIKFVTCIRNPLDQIYSNLCFPFELARRKDPSIHTEYWFKELLKIDVRDSQEITNILTRFSWLTSMQFNYLIENSTLSERLRLFSHIVEFPQVSSLLQHVSEVLGVAYTAPQIHENKATVKAIPMSVMESADVRDYIIAAHGRDYWLYRSLKTNSCGLPADKVRLNGEADELPQSFEAFYDAWIEGYRKAAQPAMPARAAS